MIGLTTINKIRINVTIINLTINNSNGSMTPLTPRKTSERIFFSRVELLLFKKNSYELDRYDFNNFTDKTCDWLFANEVNFQTVKAAIEFEITNSNITSTPSITRKSLVLVKPK